MDVNIVKLGDVAIISAGQSAPKSNYFGEEGTPFIRAGSLEFLERGESIDLCEKINEGNAKICKLKLYPVNSILFAKSGMSANKGRIYKLKQEAYIVSHLAIVTPNETKLFSEYLMYWLQKHPPKTLIKDDSYPSIGLTDIANMEIELPSLEKQKQIAQILDKADEIRQKKKQANEKLDEFLKSTFIDMFGDPVRNNKNFPLVKFADMGTLARGKSKHRPRNAPELLGGKYPLIQTGDIANTGLYLSKYTQTYSELGLKQSKMWKSGTLCITIAANIAKTAIITFDACFPDSVVGFINNEKSNVHYIQFWLMFLQVVLEAEAPQSAQKNINLEILNGLFLPYPPIKQQNKFAQIVEKVEAQRQKNEQVIKQMDNLFNALSQKAFKGEL